MGEYFDIKGPALVILLKLFVKTAHRFNLNSLFFLLLYRTGLELISRIRNYRITFVDVTGS